MHVLRLVHFGFEIWTYLYFDFFFFVSCSSRSEFAVTWFRYSLMVDDTLSRVDIGCFFPFFFLSLGWVSYCD